MQDIHEQVMVLLAEMRALLARENNDFGWSRWNDTTQALADFDAAVANRSVTALFAPTGSLQEVSISSGWGDDFIRIANAIDGLLN